MVAFFREKIAIKFERQKRFDGCKDIRMLPFDFYLLDYNICIEYDGEQHFIPKDVWGGIAAYNKIKQNDAIKEGMPLLTIYSENERKLELAIAFAEKNLMNIVETEKVLVEEFN